MQRTVAACVKGILVTGGLLLAACGGGNDSNSIIPSSTGNISVVNSHAIAFRNHTAMAWGYNGFGQLGIGILGSQPAPVPIAGISGVQGFSAGGYHSLAFTNRTAFNIWAWGANGAGQLGDGSYVSSFVPIRILHSRPAMAVAAGGRFSLALDTGGKVWAWGENVYGQLGNGTTVGSTLPSEVYDATNAAPLNGIVKIAAGGSHALAQRSDHTVWAWGYNGYGQLGDGTTIDRLYPVKVQGLSGVIDIAAAGSFSLALKNDGTVWAWGYNGRGQLGTNSVTYSATPLQVASLTGVTAIAAGLVHSVALDTSGVVWTWGMNSLGQLGNGTTLDRSTPGQVAFTNLPGYKVRTIMAYGNSTFAFRNATSLYAWGDNTYGQLGIGVLPIDAVQKFQTLPTRVVGY